MSMIHVWSHVRGWYMSSDDVIQTLLKMRVWYIIILDCLISMTLVVNGTTVVATLMVELPQLETHDLLCRGRTSLLSSARVLLTCSTNKHIITFWMKTHDRDLSQNFKIFIDRMGSKKSFRISCKIHIYFKDLQYI